MEIVEATEVKPESIEQEEEVEKEVEPVIVEKEEEEPHSGPEKSTLEDASEVEKEEEPSQPISTIFSSSGKPIEKKETLLSIL